MKLTKKAAKKHQKLLATALIRTPESPTAASATPAVSAAAASYPSPQSASFGSIQPPGITIDQSIRATHIDQPMLLPTLLPVTEPTIPVVPVPALSEASAPACQPSLTTSDISTSPEVNLDSMVATQVKHYVHPTEKYPRLSKMPTRAQVVNITDILSAKNCPYSIIDVVPVDVIPFFETLLQRQYPLDRHLRDECLKWRTESDCCQQFTIHSL